MVCAVVIGCGGGSGSVRSDQPDGGGVDSSSPPTDVALKASAQTPEASSSDVQSPMSMSDAGSSNSMDASPDVVAPGQVDAGGGTDGQAPSGIVDIIPPQQRPASFQVATQDFGSTPIGIAVRRDIYFTAYDNDVRIMSIDVSSTDGRLEFSADRAPILQWLTRPMQPGDSFAIPAFYRPQGFGDSRGSATIIFTQGSTTYRATVALTGRSPSADAGRTGD